MIDATIGILTWPVPLWLFLAFAWFTLRTFRFLGNVAGDRIQKLEEWARAQDARRLGEGG